ncbi:hypothetical protein [Leucobacter sp.]
MSFQNPSAPDHSFQQVPPQFQQPQHGVHQNGFQQPQPVAHGQTPLPGPPPHTAGGVNVLGVVALVLVSLPALMSFFVPLIYRQAAMSSGIAVVGFVIPMIQLAVLVVAAGLAIAGVLQRGATRLRWAAVGALVSAALGILSIIGGTVGGWALSMMPY